MDSTTNAGTGWMNNPAWTLLKQAYEGRMLLVLTGGADETYIVDEATSDTCVHKVFEAWQNNTLPQLLNDHECSAAVRQIQRAGALLPASALCHVNRYSVIWLGEPRLSLITALNTMLAEQSINTPGAISQPEYCSHTDQADILLVVRTNASWQVALEQYATLHLQKPNLFIDTAYHHTLVIGPYAIPEETACMACLGHRVSHRWGDMPGPEQPAVANRPQAIAALLAPILMTPDSLLPFLEHSVSLNLQTLFSSRDKVFQLPWCPACGNQNPETVGSLPLPWQPALSQSESATLTNSAGYQGT